MTFLDEIEACLPSLRRYAFALLRNRDAADDLVQDTLERALSRRHLWRGDGPLRAWLFRILLNRFRDDRRRDRTALSVVGAMIDPPVSGGQDERLDLREVHEAMGRLPPDQRAALLLVGLEGMSLAEAARILELPEGTLASRLGRARAELRAMTGRSGPRGERKATET